jgi:hypothetical protein
MSGNQEGSPPMTTTAQQTEAATAVTTWLAEFSAALVANDPARAAALFTEDCFWRDLISFTWNFRTFEGRAEITRMLEATLSRVQPTGWAVTDGEEPAETDGITEAWINFETSAGRGTRPPAAARRPVRNWPVFSPKDKIADWLESYTKIMELNYWPGTEAKSASYNEASKEWTVNVERDGEAAVLRPKQLVLATGMSGKPNIPSFPGMDTFRGDQHHSYVHPGPDAYKGKRCVVIGSNNSAFDICGALWESGADVTMVQRSSTHIVRSATLMDIGLSALYSERAVDSGITTEKADLIFASIPYRIMHQFQVPLYPGRA